MLKRFSYSSIILLAGIILIAHTGCENDPREIEAMTRDTKEIEEARDIEAIFSQTANLKAILKAPIMYRVKGDTLYTEFPKNILVNFYKDSNTLESVVTSRYAKYFELLHKVYLRDSVVVYNMTGDTLYAEDLWWDQTQEIFYSDNPVKVRSITQQLDGSGIIARSDFSKYTLKQVSGPVTLPENFDQ